MDDFLSNLMDDFIGMADKLTISTGVWREEPVDLMTFFCDKQYLGERPYPGKQTELLETLGKIIWWKFSKEEVKCPLKLREVEEAMVLFGKGSGKDFLASGILSYVCYVLCCMNDPQGYFDFGQGENIDVINVAMNSYQANNVFFKKLKARLTNCKWFTRTTRAPENCNEYQFTKNQIRFYRNITAHSAHSEADSYEGFNPLVVIFDEIGGYEPQNAENCYSTLRSSAVSRFNNNILLVFISFPRSCDDIMVTKYNEFKEKDDPKVWGIMGASWEVNPKIKREALQKDYDRDPEGSKLKYECIPPTYLDGFFQYPDKIDECVEVGKTSSCPNLIVQEKIVTRTLSNGAQRHFVGLELHNLVLDPAHTYYLGGDCGVTNDSYSLCLCHAEPILAQVIENGMSVNKWFNKPVEDLILHFMPSKKDKLPVDLMNVADILETICKQVFVKQALFDKFNSAEVVQRLMSFGVDAQDKNFSNPFQLQIYQNFKSLVYTGQCSLLDYTSPYVGTVTGLLPASEELKAIQLINGNKVDHPAKGYKDISDSRVSAMFLVSTDVVESPTHSAMPMILGARVKR